MTDNQSSNLKTIKIITYFWIGLFLFSIVCMALIIQLDKAISVERLVNKDKIEMTSLGYLLAQQSDFLTSEARNFAVTANPEHLMLYWDEVNLGKKRDYAVTRLRQLSHNSDEVSLLAESKSNSDALMLTETKSMRLVLDAHNVPDELMPDQVRRYTLTAEESELTPNQKILLAQAILFDNTYTRNKKAIMDPVDLFEEKLKTRTLQEQLVSQSKVDMYRMYLIASTSILAFLIFCIVWLRTLYLK